jgi:hypothetical protein
MVSDEWSDSGLAGLWSSLRFGGRCGASFHRQGDHVVTVFHPLMEEKGMTTMRLQRLHLSSNPCPRTLAIS